jgi:hypothetical protein
MSFVTLTVLFFTLVCAARHVTSRRGESAFDYRIQELRQRGAGDGFTWLFCRVVWSLSAALMSSSSFCTSCAMRTTFLSTFT